MRFNELVCQYQLSRADDESHPGGETGISPTHLENRIANLEAILSITRKINTSLVLSDVLSLVIDHAIRVTQSERGFIMLADEGKELQYIIGHDKSGNIINAENFKISRSVLEDVFVTGESICIEDAMHDERFERRSSIMNLELRAIMCAPLQTQDKTIGVIYVDSRYLHPVQREEVLRTFEILAGQAANAIQNARLYENLKKTYDELEKANEHIVKSEKMVVRGEIAAEVCHELRNMLNVATFQLDFLGKFIAQNEKNKSQDILQELKATIKKISNFSENLLTRSSDNTDLVETQLSETVENFAWFIKRLPKYRSGTIEFHAEQDLPNILGDVDQIQQVLLNLANNAIEADARATIRLSTRFDASRKVVLLVVSDNGPGIAREIMKDLFTGRVTTKPDGHGFGLPICKKIMDNHNGMVSVESELGKGTSFFLSFPVL